MLWGHLVRHFTRTNAKKNNQILLKTCETYFHLTVMHGYIDPSLPAGYSHMCWLSLWCHWMSSAGIQCAPSGDAAVAHSGTLKVSALLYLQKPFCFCQYLICGWESFKKLQISAGELFFWKQENQVRWCYTCVNDVLDTMCADREILFGFICSSLFWTDICFKLRR